MEINSIIKDVLLDNDSVVIEGIGEFKIIHKSAIVDESGKMQAPSKQLVFNAENTISNNVLMNYLKRKQGINDNDAKLQIADFVNTSNAKLKLKKEIVFEEVGTLYEDRNGKYNLKNIPENSVFVSNLGMNEINIPKKNNEFTNKEIETISVANTKTVSKTKTVTKTKKSNKTLKRILIALPIIILLILAVFFYNEIWTFTYKFAQNNLGISLNANDTTINNTTNYIDEDWENIDNNNNSNNVDNTNNNSNNVDNTNSNETNSDNTEINNDTTKTDNTEIKTDDEIIKDADIDVITPDNLGNGYKNYYLIVGSFKRKSNADRRVQELKTQGYIGEIVKKDGKLYRIAIGGYDTAQEAVEAYKQYLTANRNADIWLLINE